MKRFGPAIAGTALAFLGLFLTGVVLALSSLSSEFTYKGDPLAQPILLFVALLMGAGVVYLLGVQTAQDLDGQKAWLAGIIALGFLFRLIVLTSTPILEDDYYRYLWDGAVVAQGVNPYRYSPEEVLGWDGDEVSGSSIPRDLSRLATESGEVIRRINHPHLRSIYPPVAQAAFVLAYWIEPWSLRAWRLILLGSDILTLVFLWMLFLRLGVARQWLIIYWWNPLMIWVTYNAAHMDVVILPFVLGAILLAINERHTLAGLFLGVAVGAKVWPILLFPLILRGAISRAGRFLSAAGAFVCVTTVMVLPIFVAGLGPDSGFTAYRQSWENNDALFRVLDWGVQGLLAMAAVNIGHGGSITRLTIVAVLALVISGLSWKKISTPHELCESCFWAVAALFLLSPTQYPWYYLWVLPLLTLRPRWSLLLLTALMPLYYLQVYVHARSSPELFDNLIVWIEYLPVWLLLLWEWVRGRGTLFPQADERRV